MISSQDFPVLRCPLRLPSRLLRRYAARLFPDFGHVPAPVAERRRPHRYQPR